MCMCLYWFCCETHRETTANAILVGFDESYHVVRSNILMLNPLPSVSQACSIVLQEEQQKEIKNTIAPVHLDTNAGCFLGKSKKTIFE